MPADKKLEIGVGLTLAGFQQQLPILLQGMKQLEMAAKKVHDALTGVSIGPTGGASSSFASTGPLQPGTSNRN